MIEKSELNRSIEIDGIAKDNHSLLVVECKYTNKKKTVSGYEKMKENVSIKMFSDIKRTDFYIISKCGFDDSLRHLKEDNLHLITIDDMFRF